MENFYQSRTRCKALTPQQKRKTVQRMREMPPISERRACRLVGLSRSVHVYQAGTTVRNAQLKTRLIELAQEPRRFG